MQSCTGCLSRVCCSPPVLKTHSCVARNQAMPVHFIVTGFGEFAGVKRNPTQALVEWLACKAQQPYSSLATPADAVSIAPATQQQTLSIKDNEEAYTILSCTVLEVSASAVEQFLDKQHALLSEACSAAGRQPVVLLHLGVDTQRNGLNLELQAYNNATFRVPDQSGWQPTGAVIEQGPSLGLHSIRTTALPVQQLAQQLQVAGFDCHVSHDAGKFVCNYIYHKSLQLAEGLQQQQLNQRQLFAAGGGAAVTTEGTVQQGGGSSNVSGGGSNSSSSSDKQEGSDGGSPLSQSAAASKGSNAGSSSDSCSTPTTTPQLSGTVPCDGTPCYSLFVHVPSFSAVPEQKQQEFLLQLLQCISKSLGST